VINPMLEFSERVVEFNYTWTPGSASTPEACRRRRSVQVTNQSGILLSFMLSADTPFNLSHYDCVLQAGESLTLDIDFDPLVRDDRTSDIIDKTLNVVYRGHPQKDSILLKGEIVFPNLKFDTTVVNFGCALNDTSKVGLTNLKPNLLVIFILRNLFLHSSE
jgi:hydrocephalus-inducing protein